MVAPIPCAGAQGVSPIRVRYSDNSCALFAKCIYFVKRIYHE